MKEITIDNGIQLIKYLKDINNGIYRNQKDIGIVNTANKLMFNYCASYGSFIYMTEKELHKLDKEEKLSKERYKQYHEETMKIFNENDAYRIIENMRDYIVHYSFPISGYRQSLEECKLICNKSNLKLWKSWNKYAVDALNRQKDEIDLYPIVYRSLELINILFMHFQTCILDKLEIAINTMLDIFTKYNLNELIILTAENEEELKRGEIHSQTYSITSIRKIFNELMGNPLIKLVIKDEL